MLWGIVFNSRKLEIRSRYNRDRNGLKRSNRVARKVNEDKAQFFEDAAKNYAGNSACEEPFQHEIHF